MATNDIFIRTADILSAEEDFEKIYISSREKEYRVYTDEEVKQLPSIGASHIHYAEWQVRRRSAERLMSYLEKKNKKLSILEVGCGNGWLAGKLAAIGNSKITGADINKTELAQARRVFGSRHNLVFEEGGIKNIGATSKFDVVIFAASIQYFPSFRKMAEETLSILNAWGEIHILDSFFYEKDEAGAARRRSQSYYRSIGCGEMASYYFHHAIDVLTDFNYQLLFDPNSLKNKLFGKKDPFPWICIKAG